MNVKINIQETNTDFLETAIRNLIDDLNNKLIDR